MVTMVLSHRHFLVGCQMSDSENLRVCFVTWRLYYLAVILPLRRNYNIGDAEWKKEALVCTHNEVLVRSWK